MELIGKVVAAGVVTAVLAAALRRYSPETALQISIVGGLIIFLILLQPLREALETIREFAREYRITASGVAVLLKVVGIAYLCEFAIQILRDAGENAVAGKVELGGKIAVLLVTLPVLQQLARLLLSLL